MANRPELQVAPREITGKAVKRLRKQGMIPANIFGHHQDSVAIQLHAKDWEMLGKAHGAKGIISLSLGKGGKKETALTREVQINPRNGEVLHLDFSRVSLNERIEVKVALHFIGDAPVTETEDAIIVHLLDELDVECVANDIVEFFEVDISGLVEIDQVIRVEDLKLPAKFKILTDFATAIVKAAAQRIEEVAEAPVMAEEGLAGSAPRDVTSSTNVE